MEPRRTEEDTVHRASREKIDAARRTKDECAYTRKSLKKYLLGHLFRFQKNRIDRHVKSCALCKSEFDALKRGEETRQILKYIDLPEGMAHQVKEGVSALAKLKMILYRPLWIAGLAVAVAGLAYYATLPRQIDLEIESLVKTAPVSTAAAPPAPVAATDMATTVVSTPAAVAQVAAAVPEAAPEVKPLAVSITPLNETSAIRRINEVMRGHGQMRKLKFSKTEREMSGKLTAQELLTFFARIEEAATVRYNRKRFESFPDAQQIPFVLTLKAAPRTAETPATDQAPAQNAKPFASAGTVVSAPALSAAR